MGVKLVFWLSVFSVFYIYIGYTLVLYILSRFKKEKVKAVEIKDDDLPEVTLFIAAWNEKDFVKAKIKNSSEIDYPVNKLKQIWVTDGSDDGTNELLSNYPDIIVLHEPERKGKIGAMNRGMKYVKTPIVVFCDANTYLNRESIREIVSHFSNERVGCVAGEKRIFCSAKENASGSGEGIYWKYESFIKKTESMLGSTVGAAGELFAIRTQLYQDVEANTILDDFLISMRIIEKGFSIKYSPGAYAQETSSASVEDELKRKIRIAAGGFQVIPRLKALLNPFKFPWVAFTYFSHKVLRWTALPFVFLAAFVSNTIILIEHDHYVYTVMFFVQVIFYSFSILGYLLRNREIKIKGFFIPYYLNVMNYAVVMGLLRHLKKKQNVNWARANRAMVKQ